MIECADASVLRSRPALFHFRVARREVGAISRRGCLRTRFARIYVLAAVERSPSRRLRHLPLPSSTHSSARCRMGRSQETIDRTLDIASASARRLSEPGAAPALINRWKSPNSASADFMRVASSSVSPDVNRSK
jgi:hypothetical protein